MESESEKAVVAVFQLEKSGHLRLEGVYTLKGDSTGTTGYSVDWCELTQEYVYHCSSGGFGLPLEIDGIYWSRRPEDVQEKPTRFDQANERNRTRRLAELPIEFQDEYSSNIFDWLQNNCRESDTEYCSVCRERIPTADTNYPCDHIWWCEESACWSTPDERIDCVCEDCKVSTLIRQPRMPTPRSNASTVRAETEEVIDAEFEA